MKKTILAALAVSLLIVWAVAPLMAGSKCCAMGKKKGDATCAMDGKSLKECKFSTKASSKDDKPCFVCPDRCSASVKEGKCEKCGKTLDKLYCQSSGKDCFGCAHCGEYAVKGGKCPKCGMAMKKMDKKDKAACPYMTEKEGKKGSWSKKGDDEMGRTLKGDVESKN